MLKKRMVYAAVLVSVMVLVLSACGGKQVNPPTNNTSSVTKPPASQTPETLTGTGIYTGQADPHTVEIEMDGKATAFQLGEGVDAGIGSLNEGDAVSFEYTKGSLAGGLTITKIAKTGNAAPQKGNRK